MCCEENCRKYCQRGTNKKKIYCELCEKKPAVTHWGLTFRCEFRKYRSFIFFLPIHCRLYFVFYCYFFGLNGNLKISVIDSNLGKGAKNKHKKLTNVSFGLTYIHTPWKQTCFCFFSQATIKHCQRHNGPRVLSP